MPSEPPAIITTVSQFAEAGQWQNAEIACRSYLAVAPDDPTALLLLGRLLRRRHAFREAADSFRHASSLRPGAAQIIRELAETELQQKNPEAVIGLLRPVLAHTPDDPASLSLLGIAYVTCGFFDIAENILQRALILSPNLADTWCNLGVALEQMGRIDDAITAHERAVTLAPSVLPLRKNRQLALLLAGRLREGWNPQEFCDYIAPHLPDTWTGTSLTGRTVLVYNIEGHGDALHFARYLPQLRQQAARLILEIEPELMRLMSRLSGVDVLIPRGAPRPSFDCRTFFQQIPYVLGTDWSTLPAEVPYLSADPMLTAQWGKRLGTRADGERRIGLVWAGGPTHPRDHFRSLPLAALAPLATIPDTTFYALQKGPAAAQASEPPAGLRLINLGPEIQDFADSAAILMHLDLLIAVDTSIVHLAGALARPAWVLLPFAPDFRWLQTRSDSPWYPTLRLFRQPRPDDWHTAITALVTALQNHLSPYRNT